MALIRVFDRDGTQLGDTHRHVIARRVTNVGALVLTNDFSSSGEPMRVVYAPGTWHVVHEWPSSPDERDAQTAADVAAQQAETAVQLPVPVSPAAPPKGSNPARTEEMRAITDLLDSNPWMSDRDRIGAALRVPCICDTLRCPRVLNGATVAEKRTIIDRMWGRSNVRGPNEAEPLRRCSLEAGHAPLLDGPGHVHHEAGHPGAWPYGPSNHHADCFRHPARYNRASAPVQANVPAATEEGQPAGAGITSVAVMERSGELVRPFITRHLQPEADAEMNEEARSVWGYCGVVKPGTRLFCMNEPHGSGDHESSQGGESVRW